VRGNSDSIVALSTCNGAIRGVVFDGIDTYYIENKLDRQQQPQHFLIR